MAKTTPSCPRGVSAPASSRSSDCRKSELDLIGSGSELVVRKGYPLQTHSVITEDGFILRVLRIAHGADGKPAPTDRQRPVVLLQHGLLDSSDTWVLNKPDESLAFLLADAGFDVWMGNSRGNRYSRSHSTLKPDKLIGNKFWNWSFTEMGLFDIPAVVEYIKKLAGVEKIAYVAHSQGCTQMFVNLSSSKSVSDSLSIIIAMGPALRVHNTVRQRKLWGAVSILPMHHVVGALPYGEF
eukprot:737098_1